MHYFQTVYGLISCVRWLVIGGIEHNLLAHLVKNVHCDVGLIVKYSEMKVAVMKTFVKQVPQRLVLHWHSKGF